MSRSNSSSANRSRSLAWSAFALASNVTSLPSLVATALAFFSATSAAARGSGIKRVLVSRAELRYLQQEKAQVVMHPVVHTPKAWVPATFAIRMTLV